MMDDILQIW